MINTGVRAMRVLAVPASVFCSANREKATPRKGPKIARIPSRQGLFCWPALP